MCTLTRKLRETQGQQASHPQWHGRFVASQSHSFGPIHHHDWLNVGLADWIGTEVPSGVARRHLMSSRVPIVSCSWLAKSVPSTQVTSGMTRGKIAAATGCGFDDCPLGGKSLLCQAASVVGCSLDRKWPFGCKLMNAAQSRAQWPW